MSKKNEGYLKSDSLFLGLTRPPMIFGVTYMYVVLNLILSLMYFVMTSDFKVVLIALAIHGIAYIVCLREPLLIEIFILRQRFFTKCKNRMYYKRKNSYDPF